ncbi:MAG: hypothetical protein ACTS80_01320 [Candidatus Hodgkinia cicadicola]
MIHGEEISFVEKAQIGWFWFSFCANWAALEENRLNVKLDNFASLVEIDSKLRNEDEINEQWWTNVKTCCVERRICLKQERRLITLNI